MSNLWRLEDSDQFCMTLSLDRSPEEIIRIYGGDETAARILSAREAPETPPAGTTLRIGSLGDWRFCIEFENPVGFTEKIIRDLSRGTEAIVLFRTVKALKVFHYVINGRIIEWFEPGYPPSSQGCSPHEFSRKVHTLTDAGMKPIAACLEVITGHTGQEISEEKILGPLLSVVIHELDRDSLGHPNPPLLYPSIPLTNSRPLGPQLKPY
ncbi:DUF6461 domain-containing protein [Streptomyces sp. NPDC093808]|uniref:DUF6461 domain-containing protein n=1 Tax=unclassified Streptomyces TaxID=2593676 RepID=UPI00344B702A